MLRRQRARRSYIEYAKAITIPGVPQDDDPEDWLIKPIETSVAKHHFLLVDAADKLIHGELIHEGREADGVMAMAPPGSAKSTYLDVVVPTAAMGEIPGYQVILTGYGSSILKKHGRRARQVCASKEYQSVWNTGLRGDNRAVDEWSLENGSEYMSGGLLSGLTGNRGDLLIVDDPVKGREEAESETMREKIWDAYSDDALTRLKPGGKQFIIQTRWHEDDLAGRILPEDWQGESGFIEGRDGRLWYIICLQAECERNDDPLGRQKGDFIWPEWFTPKHLEPFKSKPRTWRSLFQQMPTAQEGIFFMREWFGWYDDPPERLNKYISIDSAETDEGGDLTWITVWGVTHDRRVYVLDMWGDTVNTAVWVNKLTGNLKARELRPLQGGDPPLEGLLGLFKPLYLIPESDNIWKAVEPFLRERMMEEGHFVTIKPQPHGGADKQSRAAGFQGIANMRRVYLPKGHPYVEQWLDQHLKFPSGKRKDAVDASGAFGRFINKVWSASKPKDPEPELNIDAPAGHFHMPGLFEPVKRKSW